MVALRRKLYFSKDPEGVQHFPGCGGGIGGSGSAYVPFVIKIFVDYFSGHFTQVLQTYFRVIF